MATIQQTLERAVGFHRRGELERAETLYRQVIRLDPRHADACNLLGVSCHQRQMRPEAVRYLERAVELNAGAAAYRCNLGMAYRGVGRLDDAETSYRRALELQPAYPEAQFNLGIVLQQQERLAEAEVSFRRALAGLPNNPDVLLNLGNVLQAQERCDEAQSCFRQILDRQPAHFEAQFNLANCYKEQKQHVFAADHYGRAVKLNPACAAAHFHLANMLQLQERNDEAIAAYRRVLEIDSNYPAAHNNMGGAWFRLRKLDEAAVAFARAIELDADHAEAHNNLGRALFFQGNSAAALERIHRALELQPDLADAYLTMGEVYAAARQLAEAGRCFERAVELEPHGVEGWRRLANVSRLEHQTERAAEALRRAVGKNIDGPLPSLWLATLCPAVFDDEQAIDEYRGQLAAAIDRIADMRPRPTFEEIALYGSVPAPNLQFHDRDNRPLLEAIAEVYRGCLPAETPAAGAGRPKIGFVVTSGHEGIFYRYMGGVIERLDRELMEPVIVCSPTGASTIKRLRRSDHVELLPVPFRHDLLVDATRDARFDVLYHFEVGTDVSNYFLPFFRLAPAQCTSGGNAQTSGLAEIDYFLSSDLQEPDDAADHYTERLIRIPGMPSCQRRAALPASPKTREDFGMRADETFYACPQKLRKLQPAFDPLLREILERDSRGVLLLVEDSSEIVGAQLRRRFARTLKGVADRVRFVPRLALDDYFSLVAAADVLLDPLHYGSGATMYDALTFDKPVVTLPGRFVRGRYALGIYRHIGMEDCIASSPADYVDMAVALGRDVDYRRSIERKLAERTPAIFDDDACVAEYERALLEMVEEARGCETA